MAKVCHVYFFWIFQSISSKSKLWDPPADAIACPVWPSCTQQKMWFKTNNKFIIVLRYFEINLYLCSYLSIYLSIFENVFVLGSTCMPRVHKPDHRKKKSNHALLDALQCLCLCDFLVPLFVFSYIFKRKSESQTYIWKWALCIEVPKLLNWSRCEIDGGLLMNTYMRCVAIIVPVRSQCWKHKNVFGSHMDKRRVWLSTESVHYVAIHNKIFQQQKCNISIQVGWFQF